MDIDLTAAGAGTLMLLTFSGSSDCERAAFADVTKKSDTCCRHTGKLSTLHKYTMHLIISLDLSDIPC